MNSNKIKDITSNDAKKLSENQNVIILDVREWEEYNKSRIKNSICVPLSTLADEVENKLPNKEAEVIVYCRSGVRSLVACQEMKARGYTNLYNLLEGILGWGFEIDEQPM